jgi:predicted nuclease with TOPRIM domain
VRRTFLRESLNRYRNELMSDEERMLLLDNIKRLRKKFGVLARSVEVVEATMVVVLLGSGPFLRQNLTRLLLRACHA